MERTALMLPATCAEEPAKSTCMDRSEEHTSELQSLRHLVFHFFNARRSSDLATQHVEARRERNGAHRVDAARDLRGGAGEVHVHGCCFRVEPQTHSNLTRRTCDDGPFP